MGRQIGTVLGVAGLVAILSRVSLVDPIAAYRNGLVLVIAFFVAAGAVCAAFLTARPVAVPEPGPGPVAPADAAAGVPVPVVARAEGLMDDPR
jgi:hypothetical protein